MKRGTKVAVCHDGKWGRRVPGTVIATRRGHHVQVSFPHPETGEPVKLWARRTHTRPICFGGWADIDWLFPWYSIRKWR